MSRTIKNKNDFESFLNECKTYIWEWYLPERYVRFGIPSLNGSWIDDKAKIFKLESVLEKVHPDDIEKIFVRRNSPLYKSDEMFEIDLRINATGQFEWFVFRGKTLKRDRLGNPIYVRGVAINIQERVDLFNTLLRTKESLILKERQKTDYCAGVLQEVVTFIRNLARNADIIITGDSPGSREERLLSIKELRDQCERILELIDKVKRSILGADMNDDQEIKSLSLWEHLAELQQIYSLKLNGSSKLYFTNLYDDAKIVVNAKLFDLLIENVINAQNHNTEHGYLSISYAIKDEKVELVITCTESEVPAEKLDVILTEGGLGLSVCRLLAKRLWGDIRIERFEQDKMQYTITLPLDARKASGCDSRLFVNDELEEAPDLTLSESASKLATAGSSAPLPRVLIGMVNETLMFDNQHLFNVEVAYSTDDVFQIFMEQNPEIVFFDYNLKGSLSPDVLIQKIHRHSADTPIIVTADYALRPLHKLVQQLGARYLLNNPLSLRKVNVMIKKYLN